VSYAGDVLKMNKRELNSFERNLTEGELFVLSLSDSITNLADQAVKQEKWFDQA
jgi:hypothetical protein